MGRRRRRWDEEVLDESPAELRRSKQQVLRRRNQLRLAGLLVPSLALNLAFAGLLQTSSLPVSAPPKVYELDIIEPKPPALPAPAQRRAKKQVTRKPKKKAARRPVARRRGPVEPAVAPRVEPRPPSPPPVARPTPQRPQPNLLRMRTPGQPAPTVALPQVPESHDDDLRVDGHRIRRRRYADGGRLLSNVSGARVVAPERASFWRTRAAPKNDVGRLSLAGLASMTGGHKGVLCDHLKRFPASQKGRTIHLLIDSSPSMEGSMSSAEVCAVGVANSALQKGYKVALGRFGDSTVCYPPTKKSALIRDLIVKRDRIGGTLLPTTCGADRARGAVDVVIVSDGGFFRADLSKLAEAQRVLRRPANRGMLYLVPDARYMINPKAVGALRKIGFRVIHFGARTARSKSPGSVL